MKSQKKYALMIILAILAAAVPTYAAPIEDADRHIIVDNIKGFIKEGELAKFTIEEPKAGAFKSDKAQYLKLELKSTGIVLNHEKDEVLKDVLVGRKAYAGERFSAKVISNTALEIEIPAKSFDSKERGELELKGIKVKANEGAPYDKVKVLLKGDLVDDVELTLANYSDYGTEVKVKEVYKATAGQKLEDVEITLSELVPNSLQGNRETEFVFPKGITIDSVKISQLDGVKNKKIEVIIDKNEFRIPSIEAETGKSILITFKINLTIPANIKEDIVLLIDGGATEKEKEVLVARLKSPVDIGVVPAKLKVGVANQTGGKITITEREDYTINKGQIFLALEESTMKYTKAPKVEVVKGNLKVEDEARIVEGGLEVTVTGKSTEPSTLVISGGLITVDGTVPDGNFYVKIGGPALSVQSSDTLWNTKENKHNDIDEIAKEDFIIVSDIEEPVEKANTAVFTIDKDTYTVNGEIKTMDASPYLSAGRTMMPVRYVADALGIDSSFIVWDGDTKTVSIFGDKVVQIKLNDKNMKVGNSIVAMSAAPEMKANRVFIPVAEIARALGAEVNWDGANKTATFN